MCHICSAFRPYDPECPYTGDAAFAASLARAEAAERLRQIEVLDLGIANAEFLFGNIDPVLPFDPYEGISFPEADPIARGFGIYDIPSGTGTQEFLRPGMRINAQIGWAGDTDWFRMELVQDQAYEISLSALKVDGLGDPKLFLFDNFGGYLAENDNKFTLPGDDGALDSLLAFTATRTGVYFAAATGFGGGGSTTGWYQITLNAVNYSADTVGNTPALSAPVQVNTPMFGTIDFVDDVDLYSVQLEAGKTYYVVLDAFGGNGNPLGDPKVEVLTAGLSVIAENDDNGITRNSFVAFDIETTGTYYIRAMGARSSTGDFRLNVVELQPPPAPDPLRGVDWGVKFDKTHILYAFAEPGEEIIGEVAESAWSAYERQQAAAALNEFSKVSLLTFALAPSREQADFVLGKGFLDSGLSGKMAPQDPAFGAIQGQGWFNTNPTFWSDQAGGLLEPGAYGYSNFIHEFGHGLGLAHPHDNGGGTGQLFTGVRNPLDLGENDLNQEVFTVMSYNKGWRAGPAGDSGTLSYGIAMTPMAFDIAVIQQKYGANTNWATGDDTYVLVDTNGPGTGYTAIWDAGGTDTIRHDGAAPATIDLRPATLGMEEGGGGFVSSVQGIFGGFTIAAGVVIENAIGGSGNDVIIGNEVANRLEGRGGNDTIYGGGDGSNTLFGGDGNDFIQAGSGGDFIGGGAGNDTVRGGDGNDTIYGGLGNDDLAGGAGNDLIFGAAGANIIWGGVGNDTVQGGTGNDTIYGGGNGTNRLFGNDGNDFIQAGSGGDFIGGGAGNDTVRGGDGNDTIYGGTGNDDLAGGAGNDLIFAGTGSNIIWGGAGNDTVQGADGNDTIYGGGNGTNRLFGNDGDDLIFAGAGGDFIGGGAGNDTIRGGNGNDTIYGGVGNDNLAGGAGDDVIFGGTGTNRIWGGAGDDTIHSGTGRDVMTGGPGADVFVFASGGHIGRGATRDVITDFTSGEDRIDLSALNTTFNGTGGVLGGGQASFFYFAAGGLLIGDQNGNGAADWVLELAGAPGVAAGDFLL